MTGRSPGAADRTDELIAGLDAALAAVPAETPLFETPQFTEVLTLSAELLSAPGGLPALHARVPALESVQLFAGSDWDYPASLVPTLAARSLRYGESSTAVVEALSEIRMLAVARGELAHPGLSAEHAEHFLTQVLALNLDALIGGLSEADRLRPDNIGPGVQALCRYLLDHLGYEDLLGHLTVEVRRILAQRPVQVEGVKQMVTQLAVCRHQMAGTGSDLPDDAETLVSALFGPSPGCREDPGLDTYAQRLAGMDAEGLMEEAVAFAGAMHDTGLVSVYMPVLVRHLRGRWTELVPTALGLSSTGAEVYRCYAELVETLIDEAIHPETSQATYGLACLLERGILYLPAVAPSLWRQIHLSVCPAASHRLAGAFGSAQPPRVFLLAGALTMLGLPLGVGQGSAPTCQSARALSMWAYNEPDRLLQILARAARDDEVLMRFEGRTISSREVRAGLAPPPTDVDSVSLVTVPHLDLLYIEMGRLSAGRGEDPHKWVNPEFHGDRVAPGFCIAVDVATGLLSDFDSFLRTFYAVYHPYYNGLVPVIHPQPVGVAATDSTARFLGWHAITVQRLALDASGLMRVYFFNPNNDSGQDWGQGIVTSTQGHGELPGESSLPVAEFAARLYVFHYDPLEIGDPQGVPAEEIGHAIELARGSWAAER